MITFFIPIIFSLSSLPIARTESTTIDAKNSFSPPMSFEDNVVAAHLASRLFFSSKLFPSIPTANSLIFSIAYWKEDNTKVQKDEAKHQNQKIEKQNKTTQIQYQIGSIPITPYQILWVHPILNERLSLLQELPCK